MPLDIGKLNSKTLPATVSYAGNKVKLSYYAGSQAKDFEESLQDMARSARENEDGIPEGERRDLCEMVCKIVADWEVTDGEDKVPLDPDVLEKLGLPKFFYSLVIMEVAEQLGNGGRSGKTH